jgi:hypothetical protein
MNNWSELDRRRQALAASASADVLWDMEGQAMDFCHCLTEIRNAISDGEPGEAAALLREVRDRASVMLKSCDDLEDRVKLDQVLSKCPE